MFLHGPAPVGLKILLHLKESPKDDIEEHTTGRACLKERALGPAKRSVHMRTKRRSIKAYLVEPFKQIRFGLHVVVVCLAYVCLLGYLYTRASQEQYQQVIELFKVADSESLFQNDIFIKNAIIIGAALASLVATMMWVVIRRTHKMYGPMVSIMRFVGELKRGNYAVRIHVREKDDFQSLVTSLNDLAETLHTRHGSTKPTHGLGSGLDALDERLKGLEDGVVVVEKPESFSSDSDQGRGGITKAS